MHLQVVAPVSVAHHEYDSCKVSGRLLWLACAWSGTVNAQGTDWMLGMMQVHSSSYRAFDSINYPPLATLGVDVDWNMAYLLKVWPCSFFAVDVNEENIPCDSRHPVADFHDFACCMTYTVLLQVKGVYRPRFNLDTRVIRVPIIPGCDPRTA